MRIWSNKKKITVFFWMLKLPSDELKALCIYHLLLKELVPCEVSLYVLELEFLARKEDIFLFYELNVAYESSMFTQSQNTDKHNRYYRLYARAFELLHSLEDRYVNPIVACRIEELGNKWYWNETKIKYPSFWDHRLCFLFHLLVFLIPLWDLFRLIISWCIIRVHTLRLLNIIQTSMNQIKGINKLVFHNRRVSHCNFIYQLLIRVHDVVKPTEIQKTECVRKSSRELIIACDSDSRVCDLLTNGR